MQIFNSSPFLTPIKLSTTLPTTIENDDSNMHSIATNDHQAENRQPIRRSRRLQHRQKEREDLKHSFSDETRSINFNPENTITLYIYIFYEI